MLAAAGSVKTVEQVAATVASWKEVVEQEVDQEEELMTGQIVVDCHLLALVVMEQTFAFVVWNEQGMNLQYGC